MYKFKLVITSLIFAVVLIPGSFSQSNMLFAQESSLVTVQSSKSFDDTITEVKKLVAKNGMMVLSELNQGKILSMTGLSINAVSLFVGNPQIGNKLFSVDRSVGVAIPARLNIYEGTDGKTYVNYIKVSEQLSSFENEKIQNIAKMLDNKMAMLTSMLVK